MSDYTGADDGVEDDNDSSQHQNKKEEKELDAAAVAVRSLTSPEPSSQLRDALHKQMDASVKK